MNRFVPSLVGGLVLAGCAQAPEPAASLPAVTLAAPAERLGAAPLADPEPVDWARSNALVGELGGHAGHLRGAAASAPKASR